MYSRYHSGATSEIRIPEHYDGCAFANAERKAVWTPPLPPRGLEVAKPSPPMSEPPKPQPVSEVPKPQPEPESEPPEKPMPPPKSEESPTVAVDAKPQGVVPVFGRKSKLLQAFGFEELLLVGLIFLLSERDTDSEIVLWLALLLLCG